MNQTLDNWFLVRQQPLTRPQVQVEGLVLGPPHLQRLWIYKKG